MELAWLEDFLALVECGHFSRAAERRNISQPAFSRRVRMLENWLGAPLVNRETHRVELTPAGTEFRPIAQEVVRRVAAGRALVREVAHASALTLRFACTNVLSLTFFPSWLQRLEAASPLGAAVSLVTDNMVDCERLMVQGAAQFLLCHHHPAASTALDSAHFRAIDVGQDALVPVSAPKPDADREPLHGLPGEIDAPVAHLSFSAASGMGRIIASARVSEAPPTWLNTTFTAHLAMVLLMMAREGRGMAWLPHSLVEADLKSGALVRSGPNTWDIPMQIRLFRPRARQGAAAEAFWGLVGRSAAA
jgi:DNA-binding transcriptional LysR family regulator